MKVIYYKIWSDLWHHKARTAQVVLIVAMGALAIGVIFGAKELFADVITSTWRAANPPSIQLALNPTLDDDDLVAVKNIEGVAEAEGRMTGTLEWRLGPDDEWQAGGLNAREDYNHQKLATLELVKGEWPHRDSFAVEAGADNYFGVQVGDLVTVRISGREQVITVGGTVSNRFTQPPGAGGDLQFYTTRQLPPTETGYRGYETIWKPFQKEVEYTTPKRP